jgi:hypothetical protein
MSRIVTRIALLVAIGAFQPVSAVPIEITIQGSLVKDEFAPSFFGITDFAVPFQISFVVDGADAMTLSPGTSVITASGAGFNSQAHLFTAASLTDFVATIGNVSFSADDLVNRVLGTSAYTYDIILTGALSENGVSGAGMYLNHYAEGPAQGTGGDFQVGYLNCSIFCNLTNYGFAQSFSENSVADLIGIQVFSHVIGPVDPPHSVPEPATFAMLLAGLASMGLIRRRRTSEQPAPVA